MRLRARLRRLEAEARRRGLLGLADELLGGARHRTGRGLARGDRHVQPCLDALHALLQKIGANILDAPAEYPQYSAGYYAVFFTDPDGLKLEFVHKP